MSPRAARLLAVPFAVLAFVFRFGAELWLQPLTWDVEPAALGLLAFLLFAAVSLGAPLGTYLLLTGQSRKRPSSWQVDGGRRLVVGPTPSGASRMILAGWIAGGLILTERVPGENEKRVADFGVGTTVMTTLAVVGLLAALWIVLSSWPWLALDRE